MPAKIRIPVPPKYLDADDFEQALVEQSHNLRIIVQTVRPATIEVTTKTVKFIWTNFVVLDHNGGLRYELGINLHPGHVTSTGIHGVDLGSIWTRTAPGSGEGTAVLIARLPVAREIREGLVEWLRGDEKVVKLLAKKQGAN